MDHKTMVKAGLIMSLGMLFIPGGDTAGKLLTSGLSGEGAVQPVFVAWSRFLLGAILIWTFHGGRKFQFEIFKDWRVWLRGILLTACVTCILTALSTAPIADVFAAFFIGPILSYFLAAWLLKEQISAPRTMLLFVGFCGVLLVVKPGFGISTGLLWAILAGLFYGCFLVATRWLSNVGNARSLLFSNLVVGAIVLLPWGATSMPVFTGTVSILVLLSAASSAIGNLLYITATRMTDASRLAPLVYVQLISATTLGIFVFNVVPDQWSMIGLALLLISGFAGFALQARKSS